MLLHIQGLFPPTYQQKYLNEETARSIMIIFYIVYYTVSVLLGIELLFTRSTIRSVSGASCHSVKLL